MSDYQFKIGDFASMGPVNPKFEVKGVVPHQPFFFSEKKANVLSYGIKIWTDISSLLSQFTCLTKRRTDRILIARSRLHSMQCGKK